MKKVIKVNFIDQNHSSGRGVGVYSSLLKKYLLKTNQVKFSKNHTGLIHYPFFDLFYHTLKIRKNEAPVIVTVHDVTPLVMSDRYPKGVKGSINLFKQWLSLRKADAIITDSESSKNDISRVLRIDSTKIFVIPLAVGDIYKTSVSASQLSAIKKKYNLPDKFVLTVAGGPNPNKNLPSLAEATERLNIPLVIVGGGMTKEIVRPVHPELIDQVRLEVYPHIIKTGYVADEDLHAIYKLATLYAQASYYEGFGIPLLEAMTSGCLIVSSNQSSLPEVYYEGAITFNPRSIKSLEKSIMKALSLQDKDRSRHIKSGLEKSKTFSWEKTAELTLEVYKKINENR